MSTNLRNKNNDFCMLCKRGLCAFAKDINTGQPAQTAQADLGQYFLPLVKFLNVQGSVYRMIQFTATLIMHLYYLCISVDFI